jgi:drug/metabolite transporter (DMT)-like permease
MWPQLVITMLCVTFLFPFLMSMGVQTVDASHGGVVFGIMPIATALVAVMITMSARGRCSGSPPLPAPQS